MNSWVIRWLVLVLIATSSVLAVAQEGQATFPSVAKLGQIYLLNRTDREIVFYLESERTERTEHRLGAGEGAMFSGDQNDLWFNVVVYSGPGDSQHEVKYGLDAGQRHYFAWQDGILDVFLLEPK